MKLARPLKSTISSSLSSTSRAPAAEQQGVEEDVLAAGQLVVEAGAELEDRRDPPAHRDRSAGRAEDPRDHLEQRALAGAVVADDADGLAGATSKLTSRSAHSCS